MLERQNLRDIVIKSLKNRTVAKRIFDTWPAMISLGSLPAINVRTPTTRETNGGRAGSRNVFQVQQTLIVDCIIATSDGWSEELDAMCEQVEQRVVLGLPMAESCFVVSSVETMISVDDEKGKFVATASISIVFEYTDQKEVNDPLTFFQGGDILIDEDGQEDDGPEANGYEASTTIDIG